MAASRPLNFTAVAPIKFAPSINIVVPGAPFAGENPVIRGATANWLNVAAVPVAVVIVIGPEMASSGTVATSTASDTALKIAIELLNRTSRTPMKFEPKIVTLVPGPPVAGMNAEIAGDRALAANVFGRIVANKIATAAFKPFLLCEITIFFLPAETRTDHAPCVNRLAHRISRRLRRFFPPLSERRNSTRNAQL